MFKSKKLISLLNKFSKGFSSANPLTAQYTVNSLRDGIRFENQNKTWSFEEIERHSNAFAYGLTELGYVAGDKVVLLLEKSSTSEVVVSQIGAAKAGITLVTVRPSSKEELSTVLAESKSKGVLFSPNAKLGQETYSDALQSVIPEMKNSDVGTLISSSKFSSLRHLIHTGFYSVPGALKFKHVLFYAGKKYNTLKLPEYNSKNVALSVWNGSKLTDYTYESLLAQGNEFRKSHGLTEGDAVVIAGDVRFPFTFSVGALNTLTSGNYLVLTGNQKLSEVEKVLGFYKNSVVLIDGDHFSEGSQPALNSSNLSGVKKVVVSSLKSNLNQNVFTSLFGGRSVAFASAI